jgi:hypothetical protein
MYKLLDAIADAVTNLILWAIHAQFGKDYRR